MSEVNLQPRVLVATGAASGIGLEVCCRWSGQEEENGGIVVVLDVNEDKIDEAVARIGKNAHGLVADVRDTQSVESAFSLISRKFGRIDALFNWTIQHGEGLQRTRWSSAGTRRG